MYGNGETSSSVGCARTSHNHYDADSQQLISQTLSNWPKLRKVILHGFWATWWAEPRRVRDRCRADPENLERQYTTMVASKFFDTCANLGTVIFQTCRCQGQMQSEITIERPKQSPTRDMIWRDAHTWHRNELSFGSGPDERGL